MSVSVTGRTIGFLAAALVANVVLAGTLHVREAYACSCVGVPNAEEALRSSDAVFWGEAVGIERQNVTSSAPPFLGQVTFDVREVWKGVSDERVVVYGQGMEASCGLDFDKGETYLVFAYHVGKGGDGPLETGLCTATGALPNVEAAPAALGPPTGELPGTGGLGVPSFGGVLTFAAAVVFGSLALTGVVLYRGRGRGEQT